MLFKVRIELVQAPPDPDWLAAEDRKGLALTPDEYQAEIMKETEAFTTAAPSAR